MNKIDSETPKNSIAKILRKFSKIIIGAITIACGIGCSCFGYIFCPFNMTSWSGSPRNGNGFLNALLWLIIGLVGGALVGFLLTMLILYFAELGENAKITAQSTKATAQQSENEEMSNVAALKKYKELLDSGVISQEEFDAKKKQILDL